MASGAAAVTVYGEPVAGAADGEPSAGAAPKLIGGDLSANGKPAEAGAGAERVRRVLEAVRARGAAARLAPKMKGPPAGAAPKLSAGAEVAAGGSLVVGSAPKLKLSALSLLKAATASLKPAVEFAPSTGGVSPIGAVRRHRAPHEERRCGR